MTDVAKRRITETWREAVAGRAGDRAGEALSAYDALVRAGASEAEAAYRALRDRALLWSVDEPSDGAARLGGPGADQAGTGTGEGR